MSFPTEALDSGVNRGVACVAGATLKIILLGQISHFVGPNLAVGPNPFLRNFAEMVQLLGIPPRKEALCRFLLWSILFDVDIPLDIRFSEVVTKWRELVSTFCRK